MQTIILPRLMNAILVVSSILATSLAVSTDDKKWLLDTLLSLHRELRHGNVPTSSPPWRVSNPVPIPHPTQWTDSDDDEELALPSSMSAMTLPRSAKRAYTRMASFSLLCCNQPPTRPPRNKRPQYRAGNDHWRRLVLNAIAKSYNGHPAVQPSEIPSQAMEDVRPYYSYNNGQEEADEPHLQRRGVTVMKGGMSSINAG